MKQGEKYIKTEADKWYLRNEYFGYNCFTEYLVNLFPKKELKEFSVAEFGIGRGNNIRFLSNYVHNVDGYDGSEKAIENIQKIKENIPNIDGKRVNLAFEFEPLRNYDIIIFGFFTYMISDEEFTLLVNNSKKMLKKGGFIFMYDFLSKENFQKKDAHNSEFSIFKRRQEFYLKKMKDFYLFDFRLWDNRKLKEYIGKENQITIDTSIEPDDYNWTFSALFKIQKD